MRGETPERALPLGLPQELNDLILQAIDPLALMQRVADQLVGMVQGADGALVGLLIDRQNIRYVCGSGYLSGFVGSLLEVQGSLSGQAIEMRRTLITDDTEMDGRVNREATRAFNVRSSVCVPLGRGESPVGILNVSAAATGAFSEHDVELLGGLAEFIGTVVSASTELMRITERMCGGAGVQDGAGGQVGLDVTGRFVASVLVPEAAEQAHQREQVARVLAARSYSIALQPVFDLHDGSVFAVEALARFQPPDGPPPDAWLARAHEVGLGVELELALMTAALELLGRLPGQTLLSLNAGPQALASPAVQQAIAAAEKSRIVVELTEHAAVEDYPLLVDALAGLRRDGVRLAIDDAGAGFASLMHILRLAPDFIKLDRQLISGLDLDPVRRSLVTSLMRFAEETGATLIAEGVETATELQALKALGIRYAQGFHLARPAPVGELAGLGRSTPAHVPGRPRAPRRAAGLAAQRA
jgi:EAL domain-containing protein (putative c-di-GMP-specific phosphodiesterase class I)